MALAYTTVGSADTSFLSEVWVAWLPVVFAMVFVASTSTTLMSGYHTQFVVNCVWHSLLGSWHASATGSVNWVSRKIGHFLGYGFIGLIFRRAWYTSILACLASLRSRIMLFSMALGVVSTFALASLDEWHQTYLPQRHGSIYDALLDAAGALFLNVVMFAYWKHHIDVRSRS